MANVPLHTVGEARRFRPGTVAADLRATRETRRTLAAAAAAHMVAAAAAQLIADAARVAAKAATVPAAILLAGCASDAPPAQPAPTADMRASYVGGERCAACHMAEAELWRGSHHDLAMAVANPASVVGDFNDARFTYNEVASEFFVRDSRYWVRTDGPDGTLEEFEITHAFGTEPLQQYLAGFPDGRFQVLGIAWDSRPTGQGGQRWFHLYPDEAVDNNDPLHWTGAFYNWNSTCAECHSTNLQKNYSPEEDLFETTFSSIDVDCEACHGPGSRHVQAPEEAPMGLSADTGQWQFVEDAAIATRVPAPGHRTELETCAQCHARRSQFTDDFQPGDPLLDGFEPSLLDMGLYHADGQILDEVYVYGSFLQSPMHAAGVTCSDCHNPHSAELRVEGNALCGQCHQASVYFGPRHHHHSGDGLGTACVDCHMPAETYMVVDPRRDHSFRVPRPDLSVELGTPNACTGCHSDREPQWAADTVAEWFPQGRSGTPHYGQAIHAARQWSDDRAPRLTALANDPAAPAIARATAVSLLSAQPGDRALQTIEAILLDDDPLVQLAALHALDGHLPEDRADLGQRFLTHPLRALRLAAARVLLPARALLSERRREDLARALEEYWAAQRFNADRAEGLFNSGSALTQLGRAEEAAEALEAAIATAPWFTAAYINLADLLRRSGREEDAQALLRRAVLENGEDPSGHFALGMSLVRSDRLPAAMDALERAATLAPGEPHYQYVIGIALNSTGERTAALERLRETHARFPGYREAIVALATIHRDGGEMDEARLYAERLLDLSPSDPAARALLAELDSGGTP